MASPCPAPTCSSPTAGLVGQVRDPRLHGLSLVHGHLRLNVDFAQPSVFLACLRTNNFVLPSPARQSSDHDDGGDDDHSRSQQEREIHTRDERLACQVSELASEWTRYVLGNSERAAYRTEDELLD